MKAVSPKYAVISVGKDNQYGHPDSIIINRLNTFGVQIYRTDESGTIIVTTDGKNIAFDKKASPIKQQARQNLKTNCKRANKRAKGRTKRGTCIHHKNRTKYHSAGCQHLSKSCNPISLSDAKASGYTPCSKCNPPR